MVVPPDVREIQYLPVYKKIGLSKVVILPGSTLEKIGERAFAGTDIYEFIAPPSLCEIGIAAFINCKYLTRVELGHTVKVGGLCFWGTQVEQAQLQNTKASFDTTLLTSDKLVLPEGLRVVRSDWFGGFEMRELFVSRSVEEIQDGAFAECRFLERITFAEDSQLKIVGSRAFKSTQISELVLPRTLENIGCDTFSGCSKLKIIWIEDNCPDNIRRSIKYSAEVLSKSAKLGNKLLWNLRGERAVIIPHGVKCIGRRWFYGSKISSVTIPSDVTEIGEEAFQNCLALKKVTFASGSQLQAIGARCFQQSGVEEITIPCGLKTMGEEAFSGCKNLRTVVFQEGCLLQVLESSCFSNSGLEKITIPRAVARIGDSAFYNCKKLKRVMFQDRSKLVTMEEKCFYGSAIEEFVAPSDLRDIGRKTFQFCRNLKHVELNEGLERLVTEVTYQSMRRWYNTCGSSCTQNNRIFYNCGLEEIALPSTLQEIDKDIFDSCSNLKRIFVDCDSSIDIKSCVSKSVKIIIVSNINMMVGNMRLQDLRGLKDVVIPDGVEVIGKKWFKNSNIESVTIPASVREIQFGAFSYCRRLSKVIFEQPGSLLKVIGREAFQGCKNLRTIDLPDGLEEIGLRAFRESGLESVTTPESVRTIRQSAFCKCKNLKRVTLNEGLEALGTDEYTADGRPWCGVFQDSAVEDVHLPSTLRSIQYYAFQNCRKLKGVTLPEKLEYVGQYCFWGSELQEARIPKARIEVGEDAFSGCPAEQHLAVHDGRVFQKNQ